VSINPLVEISVALYNQWKITEKFLESLFRTIKTYDNVAVNIIDNASTDITVNELEKYIGRVTLFSNETNKGFSFPHNMIMKKSYAPFSCILHNDIVLPDNWLNMMVNYILENPKVGILGVLNNSFGSFTLGGRIEQDGTYGFVSSEDENKKIDFVSSACMMIRRNVQKTISGFDEGYVLGGYADIDFCVRAKEIGFEVVCCDSIIVDHFMNSTARLVNLDRYQETNRKRFVNKNKDWIEKEKGKAILRKARKV